jgi:hypothetical protein
MSDVLLIHTPKFGNYYPPMGDFMSVTKIPAGLLGLADIISQTQKSVQVIHLGLEKWIDPHFSLSQYLKKSKPALVGITLHFHPQSQDAVKTIRVVRQSLPDAFIFLGGFTASYFSDEILGVYPEVDAIIKGDGEEPIRQLSNEIFSANRNLAAVPNLIWRNKTSIVHNPMCFVADEKILGSYSRTRLALMKNSDVYGGIVQFNNFIKFNKTLSYHRKHLSHIEGFPLPAVRGCPFSCCYCGGGREAQVLINARTHCHAVPKEHMAKEIISLFHQNISLFFMEYVPLGEGDNYYVDLFKQIQVQHFPIHANIECRSLPSSAFMDAFHSTFKNSNLSQLVISPDSIDPSKRKWIKQGISMDNDQLNVFLENLESREIKSELFFSLGLFPYSRSELETLTGTIKKIRKKYRFIQAVRLHTIELDPASPIFLDPEKFGIFKKLNSFKDYCQYHDSHNSMFNALGYDLRTAQQRLSKDKCPEKIVCIFCCRATLQRIYGLPLILQRALNRLVRIICSLVGWYYRQLKNKDYFPY